MTARDLTSHDANSSVLEAMSDADSPHEQVIYCNDPESGLRAIIAIHSLALGPAVGGCRFLPYDDEASALADVLRLSRGMTYKAAAAGLDTGGAKAVIIGDPSRDKTPKLLEAFGRFVDRLGGSYSTAGDVGTDSDDMDIIGRATRHVAFRNTGRGGSGDSGSNTALGVFQGILAAAEHRWGSPEPPWPTRRRRGAGKGRLPAGRDAARGGRQGDGSGPIRVGPRQGDIGCSRSADRRVRP